jgi:hypothetical protein
MDAFGELHVRKCRHSVVHDLFADADILPVPNHGQPNGELTDLSDGIHVCGDVPHAPLCEQRCTAEPPILSAQEGMLNPAVIRSRSPRISDPP